MMPGIPGITQYRPIWPPDPQVLSGLACRSATTSSLSSRAWPTFRSIEFLNSRPALGRSGSNRRSVEVRRRRHPVVGKTLTENRPPTKADFTYKIGPDAIEIANTGRGRLSVTEDLEA